MTQFKKQFIAATVAATLALGAGTAFAAKGQGRDQANAGERLDYIFTQLDLTEDQRSEVLSVMEATMEAQRDAMQESREAMRDSEERPSKEDRQALREAQQAVVAQQLTDELNQFLSPNVTAELIDYLDAHRGGMGQGGNGERRGAGKR